MTTLDTLCEKLIKTYNTTIIDKMPVNLQEALYNNAFACSRDSHKQHEKDRTVLAELIQNHFTKKVEKQQLSPSYIGGPKTLTCHWSETYQKLIYIFGEEHSEETDCKEFPKNQQFGRNEEQSGMPIETYLKKLTEINDIFLDIFVEIPAYKQKSLKYSRPLSETESANLRLWKIGIEFAGCMDGTDRNTKNCSRSRIHYIDIRSVEREIHQDIDPISNFLIISERLVYHNPEQKKTEIINLLRTSSLYQSVMNGFSLAKDNPNFLDFWNGMISNNYYAQKELDHCDKQMSDKISEFIKKEIIELLDKKIDIEHYDSGKTEITYLEAIQYLTKTIAHYTTYDTEIEPETFMEHFTNLEGYLIHINAVIVDCYILCRIFKKFNLQPENPQKRRSTDEPETPSNIIIYAGDAHSDMYRKFLKEIGFTLIADIGSRIPIFSVQNCIDMTMGDSNEWSLQPLFSAWPPPIQPYLLLKQQGQFSGFGSLPPQQQQAQFSGFGSLPPQQQTTFGGGFGLPPQQQQQQQAQFSGFGSLPPQQQQAQFSGFGSLPPQQQATFGGGFGGGFSLPPQQTTFGGGFGGDFSLPPQQQTTFGGGFGGFSGFDQLSKKEQERHLLLEQKNLAEASMTEGDVGKMKTNADLKKKTRKSKMYD